MLKIFCSTHRKLVLTSVLLLILFFRLSTLELLDLVDTTESRYAAVASEMFHSGNWTTPTIPSGTEYVPYLGKPPLHFWMMAQTYKFLGIDEWTSRLPSFFSLILILGSFLLLARCLNDTKLALSASAILCSSLLIFALSGAALLDVTLTAFVSISIVSAFLFLESYGTVYLYCFWVSLGLGVLVKGPAAMLFTGLPLVAFSIHQHNFKRLFKLISPIGIVSFIVIVAPWFYLSEKANPGFLKYFFLNENVLRYVTKDYGDLYGQGHVHPYGTAILMFALGFLPWTTLAFGYVVSSKDRKGFGRLISSPLASLAFFWMITPIIFLAFIRQLHFGYVIPAMPGAALWLAEIHSYSQKNKKHFSILNAILLFIMALCPFVAIGFGANLDAILYGVLALSICYFVYKLELGSIERLATTASVLYALVYLSWSPIVGALRSTNTVISCIASSTAEEMPEVAIIGNRSFSANWLAGAWRGEIDQPFKLSFVPDRITVPDSADFLLQSRRDALLSLANLEENSEIANWRVYARVGTPHFDCSSAPWKGTNCCRYNWDPSQQSKIVKVLFETGKLLWGFVELKFSSHFN